MTRLTAGKPFAYAVSTRAAGFEPATSGSGAQSSAGTGGPERASESLHHALVADPTYSLEPRPPHARLHESCTPPRIGLAARGGRGYAGWAQAAHLVKRGQELARHAVLPRRRRSSAGQGPRFVAPWQLASPHARRRRATAASRRANLHAQVVKWLSPRHSSSWVSTATSASAEGCRAMPFDFSAPGCGARPCLRTTSKRAAAGGVHEAARRRDRAAHPSDFRRTSHLREAASGPRRATPPRESGTASSAVFSSRSRPIRGKPSTVVSTRPDAQTPGYPATCLAPLGVGPAATEGRRRP